MQIMNKNGFSRCADIYIGRLRKEGRYSTAHVYQNALLSFTKFCGGYSVSFRQVTRERLRRYEQHLYECGLTILKLLKSFFDYPISQRATFTIKIDCHLYHRQSTQGKTFGIIFQIDLFHTDCRTLIQFQFQDIQCRLSA